MLMLFEHALWLVPMAPVLFYFGALCFCGSLVGLLKVFLFVVQY
jgi:hypothetical protein